MQWTCPLPLRDYPHVILGHGGGGKLSADLVEHLILPALAGQDRLSLADSTVLPAIGSRIAISTDSYVVRPLFFPGGNIGQLAVHGTINDLAMSGAVPRYLSVGLILEEGLEMATLAEIVRSMGEAAREAGVAIVAGDTKVVGRGQADGIFINTSGVGEVADGVKIGPCEARAGDVVLLSGTIGDHGMAIMSVREGIAFDSPIVSDCASLHTLVQAMLGTPAGAKAVHVLRDPTRGGVAAALHEIARSSGVGIHLDEAAIPVEGAVQAACELLGLDPLHIANEGKLLAIVAAEAADAILEAMHRHPLGKRAVRIGTITDRNPGRVTARTGIGGTRIITMPLGEQLPRIC
jgi:hydrogenase expression/formation protein HypE